MRKITVDLKIKIGYFVRDIYGFLPMSSHKSNATTFYSIFKESKVDKYLLGSNKKQKLQTAWENIIRRHPRLPIILVRKIVPAAIEYRKYKRNPIRKEELEKLKISFKNIGYDLSKELDRINLNEELPLIIVPPKHLISILENYSLVNEIREEPFYLFKNGHYNESVRKAAEKFEVRVQQLSSSNEIGKNLMSKVFRLTSPLIPLNSLMTENEKGFQEGFQFLTMGMILAVRNIFSHGDEKPITPENCYELLIFINWLFKQLPY